MTTACYDDLQRQIVVLPRRHLDMLVPQHRQRAGEPFARRVRHDHIVDIAALGGDDTKCHADPLACQQC